MNNEITTICKPVVAHSVSCWLPLTMTWIYNQLKYNEGVLNIVLSHYMQNLDSFPWEPIYSFKNKYDRFIFRCLKKLDLKSYPIIYNEAIKKHRPCILHSHFGDQGWYDLPLANKHGLKHVVTFYGYDVNMLPLQNPVWKKRYNELFERADLFLCEGPHMAKVLMHLGCPKQKLMVQRLGVEVDNIPFVPRKIGDDGLIHILIAGTFREKKGIPHALEAIGLLKDKYQNLRVTVIGDSTGQQREENEKKKIYEIIRQYKLEPIVRMLGFQPYSVLMDEAYKHHLFLSPSVTASNGDTEGGAPVTIIEMAASGMPIISTKHCDIPEVVKDGLTGTLVKENSIGELADALSMCIEQSERWPVIGGAANQHIRTFFDIKHTAFMLENKYKNLFD